MTEYQRINAAVLGAIAAAKQMKLIPYDTGNLSESIKVEREGNTFAIYVNVGNEDTRRGHAEGEAPYMKYTNEPWSNFAPPLRGKENPNEGWWERYADFVAHKIAELLGGTLK